ncbi:hypothetical protein ACRALDRAFT_1062196 [Sodiomyces alcalophilus JCM 7366]|uniref:uncharacterized protein n=1 Tax=Sodiomyces alcalophilus JCM 7366 TaxID=591952 RepID=UPI0039B61241
MTLGNHEFDGGDDELADFLLNLTFPVISANIRSNHTVLNQTIIPYKIFHDQGVAIIGATTPTTRNIASPGPGTHFLNVADTVQACIDEIRATTDITRIVALTHIGYAEDQDLAAATSGLSLIIGGHSHTPLGDLHPDPQGDYPTVVQDRDGNDVFVVQAWRWGEYLGYIDVTFDADGRPLSYHGGPIHMDNTTAQDEALQAQIEAWAAPFEEFAGVVVGHTNVDLVQATCQTEECTLGNVMADAMYEYRLDTSEDNPPDLALVNAGGIRAAIDAGDITRGHVLSAFPFGNAVTELTFSGADLRRVLEGCVSRVNQFNGDPITSGFQVSASVRMRYNPRLDPGSRIVSLFIDGEDLDDRRDYTVVTLDFLAGGGDNIFEVTTDFVPLDLQDEVLIRYLEKNSPIDAEIEGRFAETDELPVPDPSEPVTSSADLPTSSAALPSSTRACIPRPRVTGL